MSHGETDLERALARLRRERSPAGTETPGERELVAYSTGELEEAAAESVRDYLARDAETARLVLDLKESLAAQPPSGAAPLSEAELAADWSALERRLGARDAPHAAVGRRVRLPIHASASFAWAVAASALLIALGLGAWGLRSSREKARLEQEARAHGEAQANAPYAFLELARERVRDAEGSRERPRLEVGPQPSFVSLSPPAGSEHRVFEVEVEGLAPGGSPPRTLVKGLRFDREQRLLFSVTRHALPPGTYKLRLYGIAAAGRHELADYEVEVVPVAPAP